MSTTVIKYYFMALCGFFFYAKLLNLPLPKQKNLCMLAMALVLAVAEYYIRLYLPPASILLFVAPLGFCMWLLHHTSLNCTIVTAVLASGLSYLAFIIASLLFIPTGLVLITLKHGVSPNALVSFSVTGIIQCLLSTIPFRFSRLKKGMPFLTQYGTSDLGVIISIFLLSITLLFNQHNKDYIYIAIPVFAIILCGTALVLWWKRRLTIQYKERMKAEEQEKLQQQLASQQTQIEALTRHNEELARIIHKDNKLIPAMELAVKELLESVPSLDDQEKANRLLAQLASLSDSRTAALQSYESAHKSLPKTGILSADGVIRYLSERAKASGADFECSITGSVKFLTEQIIEEADLNTLLADLGENALISMGQQEAKHLLLRISILDSHYQLDFLDTGDSFSPEVLYNLGLAKTTTHAEGSGIGLMNTWTLLQKYDASFELDETIPGSLYTKCVSLCFDGKGQYRIRTNRPELKTQCLRNDILFLE